MSFNFPQKVGGTKQVWTNKTTWKTLFRSICKGFFYHLGLNLLWLRPNFLFAEMDKDAFRQILFLYNTVIFFNKSSRWPLFLPDYFHLILKADWQSISSSNKQRQLKRKQNNLQILAWCCAPFSEPKTFTWQTEEIWTNKENCNISRHDLNGLIKLQKDNNICHWNHVTLVLVCTVVVYLRQVPAGIVSPPAFCWFVLKFFFQDWQGAIGPHVFEQAKTSVDKRLGHMLF